MSKFLAIVISFFVFVFTHYIVKNILIKVGLFIIFATNTNINDISGYLYGISIITGFAASFYMADKIYRKLTSNNHSNTKKIKV